MNAIGFKHLKVGDTVIVAVNGLQSLIQAIARESQRNETRSEAEIRVNEAEKNRVLTDSYKIVAKGNFSAVVIGENGKRNLTVQAEHLTAIPRKLARAV